MLLIASMVSALSYLIWNKRGRAVWYDDRVEGAELRKLILGRIVPSAFVLDFWTSALGLRYLEMNISSPFGHIFFLVLTWVFAVLGGISAILMFSLIFLGVPRKLISPPFRGNA